MNLTDEKSGVEIRVTEGTAVNDNAWLSSWFLQKDCEQRKRENAGTEPVAVLTQEEANFTGDCCLCDTMFTAQDVRRKRPFSNCGHETHVSCCLDWSLLFGEQARCPKCVARSASSVTSAHSKTTQDLIVTADEMQTLLNLFPSESDRHSSLLRAFGMVPDAAPLTSETMIRIQQAHDMLVSWMARLLKSCDLPADAFMVNVPLDFAKSGIEEIKGDRLNFTKNMHESIECAMYKIASSDENDTKMNTDAELGPDCQIKSMRHTGNKLFFALVRSLLTLAETLLTDKEVGVADGQGNCLRFHLFVTHPYYAHSR